MALIALPAFAEPAANDALMARLRELGYGDTVAKSIVASRPDLHEPILAETGNGVVPSASNYRPIRLYRGVETPIENYDGRNGRGPIMKAEGVRWMSSFEETARFYAGLTGLRRPHNPDVLNRGVVIEVEVPSALVPGGQSSLAIGLPLAAVPDESLFTARVGLGFFHPIPEKGEPREGKKSPLSHAEVERGNPTPIITWFDAATMLKDGKLVLPDWVAPACSHTIRQLVTPLPGMNPSF